MELRVMLSAIAVAFLSVGCTSIICKKAEDAIVAKSTLIIADQLSCQNSFAIAQWVDAKVSSLNVCKKTEFATAEHYEELQGPVGSVVCPFVASSLASFIGSKAPAEWQCSADPSKIPLAQSFETACLAVFPFKPNPNPLKGGAK